MRFRYWCFVVWFKSNEWRTEFINPKRRLAGWHEILTYVAEDNWEIISIVPEVVDTHHPSEWGTQHVVLYRIFCKRPWG